MLIAENQHASFENAEDKKAYITRMSRLLTIDELEYRLNLSQAENLSQNSVNYTLKLPRQTNLKH